MLVAEALPGESYSLSHRIIHFKSQVVCHGAGDEVSDVLEVHISGFLSNSTLGTFYTYGGSVNGKLAGLVKTVGTFCTPPGFLPCTLD